MFVFGNAYNMKNWNDWINILPYESSLPSNTNDYNNNILSEEDKAILNEDWEELIISTVEHYSKLGRKERREILKLAKEIKKNNDEYNRVKE